MQRLGKNRGGYHGEAIDIAAVSREIELAAGLHGWNAEVFHQTADFKWLAWRRPVGLPGIPHLTRRVYLSSGIHGDEPAGPLAALRLVRENLWPANVEITLLPCLNPVGFSRNTRENGQEIDLNRDYLHLQSAEVRAHIAWLESQLRFDLTLCLHEDWESRGFYVYELNPEMKPSCAEAIVTAVRGVCPIDLSEMIEGRAAVGGIIRPTLDPHSRPQWPEAFWLITHKTPLSYTLEAPSDFSLDTRVAALVAGVNAALERLSDKNGFSTSLPIPAA